MSEKTSRKGKLKELKIDGDMLQMAFEDPYTKDSCYGCIAYLDLESGDIMWLFNDDEDAVPWNADLVENAAKRVKVREFPGRYLNVFDEIAQDNRCFLEHFLNSDWTDDEELQQRVSHAYDGYSIGRWVNAVNDEYVVHLYEDFRTNEIKKIAEKYLRKRNIKVIWQ